MIYQHIDLKVSTAVAEIALHYQPSNILDFTLMAELESAIEQSSDKALLILRSGLSNFSTGVDVKIHTPELAPKMLESFHSIVKKLYDFPGLTACFLRGHALGGGLELALPCDFIFAHEEAKLAFPEIRLACFPPVAAVLLPSSVGRNAFEMIFLGEIISAKKAQSIGLVNEVFSNEEQFLMKFLEKIGSLSESTLRITKRAIRRTAGFDFHLELSKVEELYLQQLIQTPDATEGIAAFLEKRLPKYGR